MAVMLPAISPSTQVACRQPAGENRAASAPPSFTSCRYVVQFGNNSMLVRQVMRSRRWWSPGQGDPGHANSQVDYTTRNCNPLKPGGSVNFLWTQFKIKEFYEAMTKMQACRVTKNNETKLEVSLKGTIREPMVHNHFEGNGHICSKRGLCESWIALFKSQGLDPFDTVPLTFVVRSVEDAEFGHFAKAYTTCAESQQCVWIVKPGDFSNRGAGIRIYNSIEEIRNRIQSKEKCWVVQKYLERPLLVNKRKFDIRAYCLVDLDMKAYYYEDAYLRTTSEEWNLDKLEDRFAHLNNDAVQKNGANYGKFESANKLNLDEFQRYISSAGYNVSVEKDIVPQIKDRMRDCILAAYRRLNPNNLTCFEVFGFDFMIDDSFSVWLIEVNTNPCLEQCNAVTVQDSPKTKWQLIFDANKDDGRVSSPGRPISDSAGIEAIVRGPLDPFRGQKTLVKTTSTPKSTKEKDADAKKGSRAGKGKDNQKNGDRMVTQKKVEQNGDAKKGRATRAAKGKKSENNKNGERDSDNDAKRSPATRSVKRIQSDKSLKADLHSDGVVKKKKSMRETKVAENEKNRKVEHDIDARKKSAPRTTKSKENENNEKVEQDSDAKQECVTRTSKAKENERTDKVELDSDAKKSCANGTSKAKENEKAEEDEGRSSRK
eukprot:GEMP01013006.1.p1 GENE.GEMP01013006.1~~GEMP01013006.1.p1  ORF type:complete len:657 (+),score=120.69 GEMP01013006.1:247-2217(+)